MLGAIQSGGLSSRMGEDKAWLTIGGRPIIEHAIAALEPAVESMAVVTSSAGANDPRYQRLAVTWKLLLFEDSRRGCGPLAGIETALSGARQDVLVLGCDLPFVTTEVLLTLRRIHETEGLSATISLDASGRMQPLVGVYGQSCLSHVTALLDSGEYKVDRLFPRVPTRFVQFDDVYFANLNTPEDYLATERIWSGRD